MTKRIFEQEWTEQPSSINHSIEKNVFYDFWGYLQNMRSDLKALKKDYEDSFNQLSKKPLQHYIDLFNKRTDQYFSILIKDHKLTGSIGHHQSLDEYNTKVFEHDGNHFKIKDKYYKVLNKLAQSIFEIEDEIAPIVEKFWIDEMSSINQYDSGKEYFLLAHVDLKTTAAEDLSENIRNYNNSLQGLCFSAISDKKTRLYNDAKNYYQYYYNPQGLVGIIANPKPNSIVGISNTDMLSTEYIDGDCALLRHFNRCFDRNGSEICHTGTKISPPKEIFNISADTINEIIMDSENIDIKAIFYVADSQGAKPKRLEQYKKEQELRFGKKLPVIEIKQRNRLGQINLEELFDM